MKLLKTIKIPATKGKKTIAQASDVFTGYLDSDFKNWKLDVPDKATKAMTLEVQEIDKDGTYKDFFTDPDKMCLTQEQIIEFCKNHKENLRQDGYATFFLFKVKDDFFVACVYVLDDGRLEVFVYKFSYSYVWCAEYRHRLVTPQLDSETPSSEKTLGNSDTLTLENAIKICKDHGLLVYEAK